MTLENPYKPYLATIEDIKEEAGGPRAIKTFTVVFQDEEVRRNFSYMPGQTALVSVFGKGESMFCITSTPTLKGKLEFSVMRQGKVTSELHRLQKGDTIGVRGPLGNPFPVEEWRGKNLYFLGAGIGLAPVRSVYNYVLAPENRKNYGEVTIIYGARTSAEMAFRDEVFEFEKLPDRKVYLCIDWKFGPNGPIDADSEEGWPKINNKSPAETPFNPAQTRYTCFVPQLVEVVKPKPANAIAVTCGPPIAIKFITQNLVKLGFGEDQIYTTLENRMKCGIGKCGRCNIGKSYVCVDGPVFTAKAIKEMVQEF